MPTTANYSWITPTEDGSTGSWDTILNEALDAIDAQVKAVEDKTDDALTEILDAPLVPAFTAIWAAFNGPESVNVRRIFNTGGAGGIQLVGTGSETLTYIVPVHGLKPGMRITGFRSYGQAPSNNTVTVALASIGTNGIDNVISSHNHGSSLAVVTKTGLSHDVVANVGYFFTITMIRSSGSGQPIVSWMQPTVTRP